MSDLFDVYHTLSFHKRIISWEDFAQVEMNFFEDCLRRYGLDTLYGNPLCSIERQIFDQSGNLAEIDFWLKIRGDYVFMSLEIREPTCVVLHDVR
jgi:hypothetical protein